MPNRRHFLQTVSSISAAVLASSNVASAKTKSDKWGEWLPSRPLGKTEEQTTILGIGGYHFGACSETEAQGIIEAAIEGGIRFFDNARQYQDGGAEERMSKLLVPKYRDEVFIMTKTQAVTAKAARADLETSLRLLKTDHLDLWQIHSVTTPEDVDNRLDHGVLDEFIKAKDEGKVRHIGFTGHQNYNGHLRMLERTKDMDVFTTCQMPINVLDPNHESFITHVLPKVVERGISPLAMKTLAFGNFFKIERNNTETIIPHRISVAEAIHFVWSLPVTCLITGADSVELIKEKIAFAKSFKAMEEDKRMALTAKITDFAGTEVEWYKAKG